MSVGVGKRAWMGPRGSSGARGMGEWGDGGGEGDALLGVGAGADQCAPCSGAGSARDRRARITLTAWSRPYGSGLAGRQGARVAAPVARGAFAPCCFNGCKRLLARSSCGRRTGAGCDLCEARQGPPSAHRCGWAFRSPHAPLLITAASRPTLRDSLRIPPYPRSSIRPKAVRPNPGGISCRTPKGPGARTPRDPSTRWDQPRSSPPRPITSAYHRALSFTVRRCDAKSTCTMPNRLL